MSYVIPIPEDIRCDVYDSVSITYDVDDDPTQVVYKKGDRVVLTLDLSYDASKNVTGIARTPGSI